MRRKRYHAVLPLLALVLWLWRTWRPFRVAVRGASMAPTLNPGDFLLATSKGRVRLGDLVVAEHPERPGYEIVKRVAGLPGQRVARRVLRPGEYWVVGDNATASTDSRSFGPLPRAKLKGVVVFRYWPGSRAGRVR